jgi:hypothetical protein
VFRYCNLETGLLLGTLTVAAGSALLVVALGAWSDTGFGDLDPAVTMRLVIPGVVLVALGVQALFSSFFLSTLGLRRRRADPPSGP